MVNYVVSLLLFPLKIIYTSKNIVYYKGKIVFGQYLKIEFSKSKFFGVHFFGLKTL